MFHFNLKVTKYMNVSLNAILLAKSSSINEEIISSSHQGIKLMLTGPQCHSLSEVWTGPMFIRNHFVGTGHNKNSGDL